MKISTSEFFKHGITIHFFFFLITIGTSYVMLYYRNDFQDSKTNPSFYKDALLWLNLYLCWLTIGLLFFAYEHILISDSNYSVWSRKKRRDFLSHCQKQYKNKKWLLEGVLKIFVMLPMYGLMCQMIYILLPVGVIGGIWLWVDAISAKF